MSVHRHCCIVVGRWMLRDWHIYRKIEHRSVTGKYTWHSWDRLV